MIVGPEHGASLTVSVFRSGLLSRVGHDLELRAERFSLEIFEIFEIKDGRSPRAIRLDVDPRSIAVVTATRRGRAIDALSRSDRETIERNIAAEVLEAERYPELRFASSTIDPDSGGARIHGALTLHGVTRELSASVERRGRDWATDVPVHQPDFGIRPYSAMLGALQVRPDVRVRVIVPAEVLGGSS